MTLAASVSLMVKRNMPDFVGDPLIMPVLGSIARPVGSEPDEIEKLYGIAPPETTISWVNGTLTVQVGRVAVVMNGLWLTVSESVCIVLAPTESVPFIVKKNVPSIVGLPLMTTV